MFERDNSRPEWRGWHGFRRSLSTRLYQMNERSKDIQAVLRHSDARTTEAHYTKASPGSLFPTRPLQLSGRPPHR